MTSSSVMRPSQTVDPKAHPQPALDRLLLGDDVDVLGGVQARVDFGVVPALQCRLG